MPKIKRMGYVNQIDNSASILIIKKREVSRPKTPLFVRHLSVRIHCGEFNIALCHPGLLQKKDINQVWRHMEQGVKCNGPPAEGLAEL